MTENSKNICLVIETLSATSSEILQQALNELAQDIKMHCDGIITTEILDKDKREVELL